MKKSTFTFRLKILASIMSIVFLFIGVLMLVVRNESSKQVDRTTKQTRIRSNKAFSELEHLYQLELQRFARRISNKNRIPSALQEAVEEDDNKILIDAAAYELNLAQIPLAIFKDVEGKPIAVILNGKVIDKKVALKIELNEKKNNQISKNKDSVYMVIANRLFITHSLRLNLFERPVGFMTVGLPVDNTLVQRIGSVIQAEVGFFLNGKLICSTSLNLNTILKSKIEVIGSKEQSDLISINGDEWIVISETLEIGSSNKVNRIISINLTPYLSPIYTINKVFKWAGLIVLILSIVIGFSISHSLSGPIKSLVSATKKVAKGDFETRVLIKTRDEFSILAESFNYMTEGLAIKEKYRGVLDKVVSPEIAEEMIKGEIKLGGENRQVTTLFTDIRGFTAMTEGMEPQDVIRMLNEFMEYASSAIESYGGVVDKYVGDQIMAIFGAPVSHVDDPLRAILAALQIQVGLNDLNKKRVLENKQILQVGTGINTGLVVAGNMGSVKRLNYTVLGNSVNLAARLCSEAGASEILISGDTYNAVAEDIEVKTRKTFAMKGISNPIEVFKVENIINKTKKKSILFMTFLMIFTGIFFQNTIFPDPGINLISKNGKFQMDFSGRFELSAYVPQESPAYLINKTKSFAAGRLSLFSDIFIGERIYSLVEIRADRGEIPSNQPLQLRLQQAFLKYTIIPSNNVYIQVGKFVTPFGEYSNRHDSVADPFIRPPLMHEYRTMICPGLAPSKNDKFIFWKSIPHLFRPTGAPVIWGVPYQVGAMLSGTQGNFTFQIALMNSAPSSDPVQWDLDLNQEWAYSWISHLNYWISPELKIGVSFNSGPYSLAEINESLSYEQDVSDYNQIMWGLDATYTLGKVIVKAELIYDTWEVPNVYENPVDISYYLELKYKFFSGFSAALRWNAIHFNEIRLSDFSTDRWDYDVKRLQIGISYRFSRKLETKLEYMLNRTAGPDDPRDNLFSFQCVWTF